MCVLCLPGYHSLITKIWIICLLLCNFKGVDVPVLLFLSVLELSLILFKYIANTLHLGLIIFHSHKYAFDVKLIRFSISK